MINVQRHDASTQGGRNKRRRGTALVLAATIALQGVAPAAWAQNVDISNTPVYTGVASAVKANFMIVLDDSGSMAADYMPDSAWHRGVCWSYPNYNSIAYDPGKTYDPPRRADGSSLPAITNFAAVPVDGFNASTVGTVDLTVGPNNATSAWLSGPPEAQVIGEFYYATYLTGQTPAVPDCVGASSTQDPAKWNIRSTWAAVPDKANYANYYAYYRTRQLMMRASLANVMHVIDGTRLRVGYTTITAGSNYAPHDDFQPLADFNAAHKTAFYDSLFKSRAYASTPLRGALERVGKYYAGKQIDGTPLPTGVSDPIQYSCQRNFTLLSTDGGWNSGEESYHRPSAGAYQPTQLDGAMAIGNQDGPGTGTPRPMLDDAQGTFGAWSPGGPGASDTLADIAMYFYNTDLRPGLPGDPGCTSATGADICTDNVPRIGDDRASHQHMTLFTLGFGVSGELTFDANYQSVDGGDWGAIRNGTRAWPNPWDSWEGRTDDLWHAAVNGRGRYYSGRNHREVSASLRDALNQITARQGAGGSAATSTQQPVDGDNFIYQGQFSTGNWWGNLRASEIDLVTRTVKPTPKWEAQTELAAKLTAAPDTSTRKIYFGQRSGSAWTRSNFDFTTLSAAGYSSHFERSCTASSGVAKLSQCAAILNPPATLDATELAAQAQAKLDVDNGTLMVNFLRGQLAYEDKTSNSTSRVFRSRDSALGDIINSSPVFVRTPPFNYTDAGYSSFRSLHQTRKPVVYVGANDGMLHAFHGETGEELWAYVPSMVIPKMHKLADKSYSTMHEYFVDGTVTIGDVYDPNLTTENKWRTVLVGGLNSGGRGYYALDITNPDDPKVLWEITNTTSGFADLGLTYGNPVITKNKTGKWIVAFTSGYYTANVTSGDGNGHLYIVDVNTGAQLFNITTGSAGTAAGTSASPSNLGKINAWVPSPADNTAHRIYGGDMKGNLWRFDFDDNITPPNGRDAFLLARTLGPTGAVQPITTPPVLGKGGNDVESMLVAVGTGRLLGAADITDMSRQSIYVFKDTLANTQLGSLRARSDMKAQTMSATTVNGEATRRNTSVTVNWTTDRGWYVDLTLSAGERVNVPMVLTSRSLGVATNIPSSSVCEAGGSSWLYTFSLKDGLITDAVNSPAMAAGLNVVKFGEQIVIMRQSVTEQMDASKPLPGPPGGGVMKRSSWRELAQQ